MGWGWGLSGLNGSINFVWCCMLRVAIHLVMKSCECFASFRNMLLGSMHTTQPHLYSPRCSDFIFLGGIRSGMPHHVGSFLDLLFYCSSWMWTLPQPPVLFSLDTLYASSLPVCFHLQNVSGEDAVSTSACLFLHLPTRKENANFQLLKIFPQKTVDAAIEVVIVGLCSCVSVALWHLRTCVPLNMYAVIIACCTWKLFYLTGSFCFLGEEMLLDVELSKQNLATS